MPEQEFRTSMAFSERLLEQIDDLLHEAKKRGEVARNMHRNPFILKLLEDRVAELTKAKKSSTD